MLFSDVLYMDSLVSFLIQRSPWKMSCCHHGVVLWPTKWILTVLCQSFLNKRAFPAGLQCTITNFLCCQLVAWQKLDFIETLQLLDTNHNWQTVHWWCCLCRPAQWLTLIKLKFKTTAFTGDSASWKSYQKTENGTWLNLIFDLRWIVKAVTLNMTLSVSGAHPVVADRLRQSLMCDVTQGSILVPIPFFV